MVCNIRLLSTAIGLLFHLNGSISSANFICFLLQVNEFLASQDDGAKKDPLTVEQVAMGFITVANETMCRPIRALTEARGHDTSRHVLACFGGAGGQHACSIARSLGMSSVFIHRWGENINFSLFMQKEESIRYSSPQPPFWSMNPFYWVLEVILSCFPFSSPSFWIGSC